MPDVSLRVWAPQAKRVEVDVAPVGGVPTTVPMEAAAGGWWAARVGADPAYRTARGRELDYAFRLDGGDPLPDPRSPWQPQGVHAASRHFDASRYEWGDEDWRGPREGQGALGGVFYELHVGTFTVAGTFEAAIERLDHLVALGVDVVEIMPVAAFEGRWGWGYDGVALYAVHDAYGGPEALQRFVDECHAHGLGVCLDVVYNHVGASGNYLAQYGPYFTDAHDTPWGPAVNLDDDGSAEVRRFICDNALRWFRDFHLDALRLDAVHELKDDSPRHLLAQLADEVDELEAELGRPLALIAESDLNDPVMVTPTGEGGRGMDAQWDDDVHHALHAALTGEGHGYYADFARPGVLAKTLTQAFLHNGRWSSFRGQRWGAPVDPATHRGSAFVAYLQDHDQIGNRAQGDRISETVTPGQQAIGASLYLLSGFTPMIFMGEEWRASTPWQFFTDFDGAELAEAVREGRRDEFASHGWDEGEVPDPQRWATRRRSVLDWTEVEQPEHQQMLDWYAALVALRRSDPGLVDDTLDAVWAVTGPLTEWVVMGHRQLVVVANLSADPAGVPLSADLADAPVVLAWDEATTRHTGGGVELGGHGVAVLRATSDTSSRDVVTG